MVNAGNFFIGQVASSFCPGFICFLLPGVVSGERCQVNTVVRVTGINQAKILKAANKKVHGFIAITAMRVPGVTEESRVGFVYLYPFRGFRSVGTDGTFCTPGGYCSGAIAGDQTKKDRECKALFLTGLSGQQRQG